jgi:hypothetical protein
MPTYHIHRLKDHLRQQVRFAPHVSGTALVKPRDYQIPDQAAREPAPEGAGETVEAPTPYAAFFALRDTPSPLEVGDLLETADGHLCIFKFVGFEEAQWVLPEAKPAAGVPQAGNPSPASTSASTSNDEQSPVLR